MEQVMRVLVSISRLTMLMHISEPVTVFVCISSIISVTVLCKLCKHYIKKTLYH